MNSIETMDKLLKNEVSAAETYQQAMDKFREDTSLGAAEYLMPIYEDHKEAISTLQAQITDLGGVPSVDSGAWGTWAEMVQGGANILGKQTALKALQQGEESGAEDYQEALQDAELPQEVRSLIETKLLPAQQAHIFTLDRLMDSSTT
ncbi:MAG: DUF2383 domain-containing protein [Methylococcales bacterium]|nr:DUF2383 domain-containing protein [Methylococcales bacterium]